MTPDAILMKTRITGLSRRRGSAAVRGSAVAALLLAPLAAGCRGTAPDEFGRPIQGISAVLIGGRFTLPTGDSEDALAYINLESEGGGRDAEVYRLPVRPEPRLYQVEPNDYRLTPARSLFGRHQPTLRFWVDGRAYRVPFPRDILRKPVIPIAPTKIVALGVVEIAVLDRLPGREPTVRVRLNDSADARRELVQSMIRAMMNPDASPELRDSALSWTRALEQTLQDVVTEAERKPPFRPGP